MSRTNKLSILDQSVIYDIPPEVGETRRDIYKEGDLVNSNDVFELRDGSPIAMVNLHVLLSTLTRVYEFTKIDDLMEYNPEFSLTDLISMLHESSILDRSELVSSDEEVNKVNIYSNGSTTDNKSSVSIVNLHVLLSTLARVYGFTRIEDLMNYNPVFELTELVDILYRYGSK